MTESTDVLPVLAGVVEEEQVRSLRKAAILTASVAIAHSVLLVLAFFLIDRNAPGAGASDAEILDYMGDENRRRAVLIAGIYLIPFAGIAFIWFTVSLRMWLSGSVHRLTPLLANVLLVCGIIYVALLFAAGASMSVLAVAAEVGSGEEAALAFGHFPEYGSALLLVFAMRMCAMIVFALSNIGRTYKILPKWFVYVGILLGVLMLFTASLSPWLILLFPGWLLGVSLILLHRAWRIPKDWEVVVEGGHRNDRLEFDEVL